MRIRVLCLCAYYAYFACICLCACVCTYVRAGMRMYVRKRQSNLPFSLCVETIRGMFEMNCFLLSGDFKFQVSPKVFISSPRSTPRG